MIQPEMRDGDAIFFHGRLWHGSENTREQSTRTALLFQYAATDQPERRSANACCQFIGNFAQDSGQSFPAPPILRREFPTWKRILRRVRLRAK